MNFNAKQHIMDTITSFKKPLSSLKEGALVVDEKYEHYVRSKAIKAVNQKLLDKGLKIEQIAKADYEAMVCDSAKDIKKEHAKKVSQGLFTFIGFDLLMGW